MLCRARDEGRISDFLQPDALAIGHDGKPFLIEFKGQDRFEAPPFAGHGLPVTQARRYEQVRLASGVRTLIVVRETGGTMRQWLDVLEDGEHFDTAGTVKTPRRVYPVSSYVPVETHREAA